MTQEQFKNNFFPLIQKSGIVYEKIGEITAFRVNVPTQVETNVKLGKETTRVAQPGEYIVINPGGELYTMSEEDFVKRYLPIENFPPTVVQRYKPKGKVMGIKYQGDTFTYIAPWKEEAQCWEGGMLVTPYPFSKNPEVYCIAGEEFAETYSPISE